MNDRLNVAMLCRWIGKSGVDETNGMGLSPAEIAIVRQHADLESLIRCMIGVPPKIALSRLREMEESLYSQQSLIESQKFRQTHIQQQLQNVTTDHGTPVTSLYPVTNNKEYVSNFIGDPCTNISLSPKRSDLGPPGLHDKRLKANINVPALHSQDPPGPSQERPSLSKPVPPPFFLPPDSPFSSKQTNTFNSRQPRDGVIKYSSEAGNLMWSPELDSGLLLSPPQVSHATVLGNYMALSCDSTTNSLAPTLSQDNSQQNTSSLSASNFNTHSNCSHYSPPTSSRSEIINSSLALQTMAPGSLRNGLPSPHAQVNASRESTWNSPQLNTDLDIFASPTILRVSSNTGSYICNVP